MENKNNIGFCQPHWDKLRQSIDLAGLTHLVSTSGQQVAERMSTPGRVPDPLMEAHMMILQRAIINMGMQPGCPCCNANTQLPPYTHIDDPVQRDPTWNVHEGKLCGEFWIDSIGPYMRAEYTKEGWVKEN